MSVPTGIGNYPPGVTDNDPHFDGPAQCEGCGTEDCSEDDYGEFWCGKCAEEREQGKAEAASERQADDGETYRGGEAASALAEEQAKIQRELK